MAVESSVSVSGARELSASLRSGSAKTRQLMELVVDKSAADLQALTQKNANLPKEGPPGPRVITGDYKGSWRVEKIDRDAPSGGYTVARKVGTDRPQALRLEYGFVGTDSIGRTYDQQPYPHHGPAVDVIEPLFHAAMAQVAERALNS